MGAKPPLTCFSALLHYEDHSACDRNHSDDTCDDTADEEPFVASVGRPIRIIRRSSIILRRIGSIQVHCIPFMGDERQMDDAVMEGWILRKLM